MRNSADHDFARESEHMSTEIVVTSPRQLARIGFDALPSAIARAGDHAGRRFTEFLTANIRNKNTRLAYARAVGDFFRWWMNAVSSCMTCSR